MSAFGAPPSEQARAATTPRVMAHLIPRPRLEETLDGGAPIAVLRGASGSGKTSLLTQWAARQQTVLWLRVTASNSSRPAFAHAIAERLAEDAGLPMRASLDDPLDPRGILQDAAAALAHPVILIVDDGERLTDAAVFEDLAEMVSASANLRIVVASRVRTRLETAPVRVRMDVALIGPSALRFTEAETEAAASAVGLSAEVATEIHRGAGGSPMLTRAILLALTDAAAEGGGTTRDPRVIALHLLDELIAESGLTPGVLEWAVRCCVVEEVTPALAEELAPGFDHAEAFGRLEQAGFGVWNELGTRFQLTTAVREALRSRLAREPADVVRGLRRTAARWALAEGDALSALEGAVQAGDLAFASRVAQQHWVQLVALQRDRVIEMLSAMPVAAIRSWPLLCMLLALAYNATERNRVAAHRYFTLTVEAARVQRRGTSVQTQMLLSGMESAALRIIGKTDAAVRAAERSETLYRSATAEAGIDGADAAVLLARKHNAVTFGAAGRTDRAIEILSSIDAVEMAHVSVLTVQAFLHAESGDLEYARAMLDEARTISWPPGWTESFNASQYRFAEAVLAIEAFDFATARGHLAAVDAHFDTSEHWPTVVRLKAIVDLATGHPDRAARRCHDTARRHASIGDHEQARLDVAHARVLFALARAGAAERLLARHARHPEAILTRARVALASDDPHTALDILKRLDRPGRLSTRMRTEFHLARAAAATRLGAGGPAVRDTDAAVQLMADSGLRLPLLALPRADRQVMLARIQAQAPGFVWPQESVVAEPMEPPGEDPRLTERELVVLRAASTGEPLSVVSDRLHVSLHTVKSQLGSVYRKLGVTSRRAALAEAVARELL